MSFEIEFDYRFDEANFFTPERRAILEQAGDIWSSYIQDDFTPINPGETLPLNINNTQQEITLEEPLDDLLIFVTYSDLSPNENFLAQGSFAANFIVGSDRQERIQGSDFEPWLGKIEFNQAAGDKLFFDPTPETSNDIPVNQQDFLSLALHEIGHVLGIGTSGAFSDQVDNGQFTGELSVQLNQGNPIPLDDEAGHVAEGFTLDPESDALLDQLFSTGERNLPTDLDLAVLADIGYEILADVTPVYRLFQFERGFHFYTTNDDELENIVELSNNGELQYQYENIAYNVLAQDRDSLTGATIDGALPVFRFFNTDTGAHLYTMDQNERDFISANLNNYNFEGEAYYAFATEPEAIATVPLYRMLDTQTGSHLFTSDLDEFDTISATLPQFQPEGDNGVTFYVLG
ncbi:MAG: hypothetical protein AAF298_16050 [Cyanobacteria bacterium P01_A01_bin.40]